MVAQIDRVDLRSRLAPQREPYWLRVDEGRYLGFRRLTKESSGNWVARFYNGEQYKFKALGHFLNLPEKERFGAAKREAEDWFTHLNQGGSTERLTVKEACKAYVDHTRLKKGEAAAKDREGRFARLVDDDQIGKVELAKLASRHITEWEKRLLAKKPARATFNRNIAALKAALNLAYRRKEIPSDHAWRGELRPLPPAEGDEGRRTLYLDLEQRRKLIEKASDELRPYLKALALIPMRPGDVAKLRVEHLDTRHATLHVFGKTGGRDVPLASGALAHFKDCAKSKLPAAWLIARADGSKWERFAWRDAIRDAVKAAKLPRAVCAYTLRHSAITDLVTGGLDLLTVAKISGTSVAMIEKHYGHLQSKHAREALEGLALI